MRRFVGLVVIAATLAGAGGCSDLPAVGGAAPTALAGDRVTPQQVDAARTQLAQLPVRSARPGGYQRTRHFGPAWSVDVDRNGCGTRDDVLRRDLEDVRLRGRCTVVAGVLRDPYTGRTVRFTKADAGDVQVDHVVALAAAWALGARDWRQDQRERFANDPVNLQATSAEANQEKGDDTPAQWLPRHGHRCAYAVRWVQVSARYRLAVTPADRATLSTLLRGCPAGRR
jgi:hypothetical protein